MTSRVTTRLRLRRDYSKLEKIHKIPNLINVQCDSYERFLQANSMSDQRHDYGLQAVFKSVFPIRDYNDTASLEFINYGLAEPKYDMNECLERGMTWAAPLKVTIQLILWDKDSEGGRQVRDIKEQEVFFGEIPLMTERGTFVINGTERVVVSQLHRSPGVFFDNDRGKTHSSGKLLYNARVIPYRGSWLDFEFDIKDILHVRIDRRRKQNATVLLRALGMSSEDILNTFYRTDEIQLEKGGKIKKTFKPGQLEGQKVFRDIKADDGRVIVKADQKFNKAVLRRLKEANVKELEIEPESINGLYAAKTIFRAKTDVVHPQKQKVLVKEGSIIVGWDELNKLLPNSLKNQTSETLKEFFAQFDLLVAAGEAIEPNQLDSKGNLKKAGTVERLRDLGIPQFEVLYTRDNHIGDALLKTLMGDGLEPDRDDLAAHFAGVPHEDALLEIYKRLRPGDPPRIETAEINFQNLFFNPERYDLSEVGRVKLDYRLHGQSRSGDHVTDRSGPKIAKVQETGSEYTIHGVLTKEDIVETIRYLLELRLANDPARYYIDDIDHLGNRRVRSVGELVENQYRIGLVRMERAIKERMSIQDIETLMPQDLINYKPVSAVIKEFFGSSQLSQFMDQTNPLSEVTHKRRLSALGPGGLTRERAGFEVRDVHPTHYGRVCPIETPEGPNIGLISSLASYARINELGFVETPYRLVENGYVRNEVRYLTAMQEGKEIIAQANAPVAPDGKFLESVVWARLNGEFTRLPSEQVTLMDISPNQLVSVAASLIPFLEHDDANRALMGSNMQRQAVPLLKTAAPLVGTGMEQVVARDSGATLVARRSGRIETVDATRIVIKSDDFTEDPLDTGVDIYPLNKYRRSNQNTCLNQRPIVRKGDMVGKGEVIADGQSTDMGELALGRNVLVAFMPWEGYNFEDSILVSEQLVQEDAFTSIHIEEFECIARDTKLGNEEITRDIPNVGEEALKNLDESGIIRVGAEVKPGDILVGKVTPKSETQLSPEEKLLRAIFGEKAGEVRDTSLRLPPGVEGTIIDAHVFSRKGTSKDERMLEIEKAEIERLEQDQRDEIRILRDTAIGQLVQLLAGKETTARLVDEGRRVLIDRGEVISAEMLEDVPFEYLRDIQVGDDQIHAELNRVVVGTGQLINNKRAAISAKIKRLKKGDELPPGVIKLVKVFVAVKRRLSVGDKMAGRHGNKGVLSRVLPIEDMPYLPDGTPVDMVLNPLGVPSRMNVGQILETHLGWACLEVGRRLRSMLESIVDPETNFVRQLNDERLHTSEIQETISGCKNLLSRVHVDRRGGELVSSLNDVEVLQLAKKEMDGLRVASPVFEGVEESRIREMLETVGLSTSGQTKLFDGRTGESFAENVTVGVMYMLKLHHLVDDKIHARSIGPYSLVTQQPLGGKAQFGGQRLGEMEVWALEAYGAAFSLQEFLTVKSDDVAGRNRMYEAIVKGENVLEPGLPESFNVMCKELRSLGLDVELQEREQVVQEEPLTFHEPETPNPITSMPLPIVSDVSDDDESEVESDEDSEDSSISTAV